VEIFEFAMYFHIHTVVPSTWNHVWRVEEKADATSNQALKSVAAAKWSRPRKQSCCNPKTAAPT
jgi:hypothetical protein